MFQLGSTAGEVLLLVTFVTDWGKEAFHYDRRSNSIVKEERVV
jgi:hypothetical protein